jgi:hypothetical protein
MDTDEFLINKDGFFFCRDQGKLISATSCYHRRFKFQFPSATNPNSLLIRKFEHKLLFGDSSLLVRVHGCLSDWGGFNYSSVASSEFKRLLSAILVTIQLMIAALLEETDHRVLSIFGDLATVLAVNSGLHGQDLSKTLRRTLNNDLVMMDNYLKLKTNELYFFCSFRLAEYISLPKCLQSSIQLGRKRQAPASTQYITGPLTSLSLIFTVACRSEFNSAMKMARTRTIKSVNTAIRSHRVAHADEIGTISFVSFNRMDLARKQFKFKVSFL